MEKLKETFEVEKLKEKFEEKESIYVGKAIYITSCLINDMLGLIEEKVGSKKRCHSNDELYAVLIMKNFQEID